MSVEIAAPSEDVSDTGSNGDEELPISSAEESDSVTASTTEPATDTGKESGNLDADFKEAMDSYEDFMGEYVEFMEKYSNNPTDPSLLSDYAIYMEKYVEVCENFDKWEDTDLNADELAYYIEVQARVSEELLGVAS